MAYAVAGARQLASISKKMEQAIAEGRFYDAEQMYKTLHARYMHQKKYDDIQSLLLSGACLMLEHKELNAGTELASLLLDVYKVSAPKMNAAILDAMKKIYSKYPEGAPASKITFLKNCVKFATEKSASVEHLEEINCLLAKSFVEEKEYGSAQKYFLKCPRNEEFANMIKEWSKQGGEAERDLFIARPILQTLCCGNLKQANALYDRLVVNTPTPVSSPLMNYIKFLLLTLERDALPLFEILRKKYTPSLNRDPAFQQYVEIIAQVFYKVKPQNPMGGFGMFGDILKSFMGGGDGPSK